MEEARGKGMTVGSNDHLRINHTKMLGNVFKASESFEINHGSANVSV